LIHIFTITICTAKNGNEQQDRHGMLTQMMLDVENKYAELFKEEHNKRIENAKKYQTEPETTEELTNKLICLFKAKLPHDIYLYMTTYILEDLPAQKIKQQLHKQKYEPLIRELKTLNNRNQFNGDDRNLRDVDRFHEYDGIAYYTLCIRSTNYNVSFCCSCGEYFGSRVFPISRTCNSYDCRINWEIGCYHRFRFWDREVDNFFLFYDEGLYDESNKELLSKRFYGNGTQQVFQKYTKDHTVKCKM
jgi:hypothetical protein